MKSFEEIVSEIETAGFRVNNLFRRTDGQWLGNVRSVDAKMYEYAIAGTAQEVLSEALHNALQRFPGMRRSNTFMAQPGEKVPDWETYRPKACSPEDDLLGLETTADVDDLLG